MYGKMTIIIVLFTFLFETVVIFIIVRMKFIKKNKSSVMKIKSWVYFECV